MNNHFHGETSKPAKWMAPDDHARTSIHIIRYGSKAAIEIDLGAGTIETVEPIEIEAVPFELYQMLGLLCRPQ